MTVVQNFVARHDVFCNVIHGAAAFATGLPFQTTAGEVCAGYGRVDAGHGESCA